MKKCIVTGSFDPITLGHIDIIERASDIFDHVYVAILVNPLKKCLFENHERLEIAKAALGKYSNVEVISYYGMAVDLAKELDVGYFVRGMRDTTDYIYEVEMAEYNKHTGGIETLCFITSPLNKEISSNNVRQRLVKGEDISDMVSPESLATILKCYTERAN